LRRRRNPHDSSRIRFAKVFPELRAHFAEKAKRAGKPVPVVNSEHIKILWNRFVEKEAEKAHLGITGPVAVAGGPAENPLGPDVDLLPVGERFTWLWFYSTFLRSSFPNFLLKF